MNTDKLTDLQSKLDKQIKQCDMFVDNAKALKIVADSILREMQNLKNNLREIQNELNELSKIENEAAKQTLETPTKLSFVCSLCGCDSFIPKKKGLFRLKNTNAQTYMCAKCGTVNVDYTNYMQNITYEPPVKIPEYKPVPPLAPLKEETVPATPQVSKYINQKSFDQAETNTNKTGSQVVWNGIQLSDEQLHIVHILEETKGNYFITGKAGSGKSTVLNYFRATTKKKHVVLAPTGIAAINVGGQTIHSFFKLGIQPQDVKNKEAVYSFDLEKKEMIKALDMLIIDEISMVRSDLMDMVDTKMKIARNNNSPFGGCQIAVFGDLYQLQPIVQDTTVGSFLLNRYGTAFFFGVPAANSIRKISLEHVFRQSNPVFLETLNHVRSGNVTENDLQILNQQSGESYDDEDAVALVPTRAAERKINEDRLAKIQNPQRCYPAIIEGDVKDDDVPALKNLNLKVDAKVMLLSNDSERKYVNGTIGHIIDIDEDDTIWVGLKDDIEVPIQRKTWIKFEYKYNRETESIKPIEVGKFTQFPIKPAYAMTIHKSQGQTFENVMIDYTLGGAFTAGMTYVALSRCKSLEHLKIPTPIKREDIIQSPEVIRYMEEEGNSTLHRESRLDDLPF